MVQVTQGLLSHLASECPDLATRGVVLGYDGRHNSARWAGLAAAVFLRAGVRYSTVHTVQCSTGYSTGAGADVPQHGAHSLHPLHHQAEGRRGRGHGHRQPQPQGGV